MGANRPVRVRRHRGKAIDPARRSHARRRGCGDDDGSGSRRLLRRERMLPLRQPRRGRDSRAQQPTRLRRRPQARRAPPLTRVAVRPASPTTSPTAGARQGRQTHRLDHQGRVRQPGGRADRDRPTNDDGAEIASSTSTNRPAESAAIPSSSSRATSPRREEGQQCGQQLANDSSIVAVLLGAVAVGAEPLYAALGDKPVVGGVSVNAVDINQPSAGLVRRGAVHPCAIRRRSPATRCTPSPRR